MNEVLESKQKTGLRERQRAARRTSILLAAGQLFGEKGFDGTSLEDVAAISSVSVPTIYSFFSSKQDLLLGLVEEDRHMSTPLLAELLEDLPHTAEQAFFEIGKIMFLQGYDVRHKIVWREILAISFRMTGPTQGRYLELQRVNSRFIGSAIDVFRERQILRSDISRDSTLRLVQGTIRRVFQLYILDEDMEVDQMLDLLMLDLTTLVGGLKSR